MTEDPTRKSRLQSRLPKISMQTMLLIAGAVAALAAIILATSALSAPRHELPALVSDARSKDYRDALEALSSGDTTRAADLLERVVAADPDNAEARKQLKRVRDSRDRDGLPSGQDPGDDDPAPPNTPPYDWNAPVSDLSALLPVAVDGYQPGSISAEGSDAVRPFDPTTTGPADVRRLLYSIHDQGSSAAAASFVQSVSRSAYPSDGATVTINGVGAYFGGNGGSVYTVSYSRGRFSFELILTAKVGTGAATAKSRAVTAASAFPTRP